MAFSRSLLAVSLILAHLYCILADNLIISDTWVQISTPLNPPAPRQSHTAVYNVVNKSMVIFGGRDTRNAFNDINCYSIETDEWTADLKIAGRIPNARYGHSAVATPLNTMIVFGGRNQTNLHNDVAVFDLLTNKWLPINTTGTPPAPRAYHTAVVDAYQHVMYVYGGADDSDTFDDVFALDLDTYAWNVVAITNGTATSRSHHTAVLSPLGVMIAFGGVGSSSTARADVVCFDTRSHAWFTCAANAKPAPSERYGHSAVISPLGFMVIFGGKNSAGNAVSDIWNFDLGAYTWDSVIPAGLPIDGRAYHSAAATTLGSMLVFGGVNSDGTVNNDFGYYNMASTTSRSANDGAVLVVLVTLMGTIMIALCFAMDYMNEQSEIEREEAIQKAKQDALLIPKLPPIPKALHIPLGPRAQKFFDEFRTSLDPLHDPPK